ncbi:hypothetical protein ACFVH9_17760, partial [Streptomyces hirsutus]
MYPPPPPARPPPAARRRAPAARRRALAVLLEIDEIYLHRPQSLRRSGVRDPTTRHVPAAG